MQTPVVVIANPVSGHGRGEANASALAKALQAVGVAASIHLTTKVRTGTQIAAELERAQVRAVAVVGGDGSVGDVLRGLRDPDIPVALLPSGTANVLARETRIPRDPTQVAAMIVRGRTLDARLAAVNGTPFLLFVGAGLDARIVQRVEEVRRRRGHHGGMAQWWIPGWREFVWRPLASIAIEVEGRRLEHLAFVLVTRVRSYAAGMRMPPGIALEDGQLHVLAFQTRSKLRLLLCGARAVLNRLRPGRDVIHIPTRGTIRIHGGAGQEPYHRDGDAAGELPVEIAMLDRYVRLLVP